MALADEIEATGVKGASGFADGMRGAVAYNFLKPDSLDFYKAKLLSFKAKAGEW